ncbi:hypothetical protein [uncultured Marinobacter sp.]|uniref:GP88 family protein n=1 Tax=uncultured Marinobacter sp. TaxID=187379 RepID=UPI0030DC44EB
MQVTFTGYVDQFPALDVIVTDDKGSALVPVVVRRILAADNPKLEKSAKQHWLTMGVSLSPANSVEGINACSSASAGCIGGCIDHQGMGSWLRSIHVWRAAKLWLAKHKPALFYKMLADDLDRAESKARRAGMELTARLNVFSDLMHERNKHGRQVIADRPALQFYDYTAHLKRILRDDRPANYHLTYSRKEGRDTQARTVLNAGKNVAVVFNHANSDFPKSYLDHEVYSGDDTDLRFTDPAPRVIGLRLKYSSFDEAYKMIANGFAVTLPNIKPLVELPTFYVSS